MKEILENILKTSWIETIIIIVISIILYIIFKTLIDRTMKKRMPKTRKDGKKETYIKLFNNILKYVFLLITAVLILQVNGINVSSLVTGLGIAGIVAGLALQDALKDIIMGANIITENFFVIGDVVNYEGIEGKVLSIGLKNTKIQDINTKNIVSITNRNIEKIINVSDWLDIDVPISYNEKTEQIEKILNKIAEEAKKSQHIKNCEYLGINDFADSAVIYKIRAYCNPEHKPTVNRTVRRIIKLTLDENNIQIPFMQIDIHNVH